MKQDLNWDGIPVFLAVANHGNLRSAAVALRISQPTAGRRLRMLESQLGVALFTRGRDGHRLTDAGESLLPKAEVMAHAAGDLARETRGLTGVLGGKVRISANEWAAHFLACHLAVPDDGPEIELTISERTEMLVRRDADLAVRHGLPVTGNFLTRKAGGMAVAAYGKAEYIRECPKAMTEERYSVCRWVTYTEEQSHYQTMQWLDARIHSDQRVRAANTILIREAIAAGAGLGLLPCFLGDEEPRLARVSPPIRELESDYWLIVPKELADLPRIRNCIDWAVALFAEEKPRLLGRS